MDAKKFFFFPISFHFGNSIQRANEIVVHDIENGQVDILFVGVSN